MLSNTNTQMTLDNEGFANLFLIVFAGVVIVACWIDWLRKR